MSNVRERYGVFPDAVIVSPDDMAISHLKFGDGKRALKLGARRPMQL